MAQESPRLSAARQAPRTSKGKLLLAIEDRGELQYYRTILEGLKYSVRACRSFAEAARVLQSETFDLVVISQGTRQFEGRLVLERAMEIDRRIPVVVLARYLEMRCYMEAMQLGAVRRVVRGG